jgi:hypothetical protein
VSGSARRYALISPCRNEARFIKTTLDSVISQSELPALWVIVDDGSTDETMEILTQYSAQYSWIEVVAKPDRGHRAVGPGVIEAFYVGLEALCLSEFDFICKLDVDLDLPPRYFELLMDRMQADPRLGSASGKPYYRSATGAWVSEKCGDEMSVGMTKFYRTSCFQDIGGFVREVMWDGIDCHKARQRGWIVRSWDEPDLQFHHLRPMGASDNNILTGRARHGFGQYFMRSDPLYFSATAIFRMTRPPYVVGGLAMLYGYARAWWSGARQLDDPELCEFIRAYQRQALLGGKARTIAEIETRQEVHWAFKDQLTVEK